MIPARDTLLALARLGELLGRRRRRRRRRRHLDTLMVLVRLYTMNTLMVLVRLYTMDTLMVLVNVHIFKIQVLKMNSRLRRPRLTKSLYTTIRYIPIFSFANISTTPDVPLFSIANISTTQDVPLFLFASISTIRYIPLDGFPISLQSYIFRYMDLHIILIKY